MMEFMACGKPVIASYSSGHRDIVTSENSILVRTMKPVHVRREGEWESEWDDPDIDEVIAHLEWAYQRRTQIGEIGRRAGAQLKNYTWENTARKLHKLLVPEGAHTAGA